MELTTGQPALINRAGLVRLGITVSKSTIYRWEALGRFPRHIRMAGTSVAWLMPEIEQWPFDQAAERINHHYAEF
ncbi:MAG: AlpA family phage regulatory protein [Rhizobiaceae bacterium]